MKKHQKQRKNLSINMIALGNLRHHKKQYVTMVLGIILAIFFSASLLLFGYSISVSIEEIKDAKCGSQDLILYDCKDAPLDQLRQDGFFQTYGTAHILGYAVQDARSEASTGFSLAIFNDEAQKIIGWNILEGRMPKQKGEIAIEQSALSRLRTNAKVGDMITMDVRIPDGDGGFLEKTCKKRYKLTGILSDRLQLLKDADSLEPVYRDIPAGVLSEQETIDVGGKAVVNCYAIMTDWFLGNKDNPIESQNSSVLLHRELNSYTQSSYNFFYKDNYPASVYNEFVTIKSISGSIALVAVVLITASCLGIINAFSANLQERQKQIGLLRAVAATKRQIRQIFGWEALIIACISVLPALALACLAVWSITRLMGPGYHLVLNPWILVGAAAVGLLCILLASLFPLYRASQITPMQAIRDVRMSRRMKTETLRTRKQFRVPQHLARRNLRLYRGNLGIIAMITLSMYLLSLFTVTGVFDSYTPYSSGSSFSIHTERGYSVDESGMVYEFHKPGLTETDRQDAAVLSSVETVNAYESVSVHIIPKQITDYLLLDGASNYAYLGNEFRLGDENESGLRLEQQNGYHKAKQTYGYPQDYYIQSLNASNDELLSRIPKEDIIEGEINLDRLASGEEILVYAPFYIGVKQERLKDGSVYNTSIACFPKSSEETVRNKYSAENIFENDMFHAGDTITISLLYTDDPVLEDQDFSAVPSSYKRIDKTVTIGAVIDASATDESGADSLLQLYEPGTIFTSISGMQSLGYHTAYNQLGITLSESPSDEMEEYLESNLESIAARVGSSVENYIAFERESRNMYFTKLISRMSVMILFFVICMSMVSNSISSRIQAGKRSIGTLRAVGASGNDITCSYLVQILYTFLCGVVLGLVIEIPGLLAFRQWYIISNGGFSEDWPLSQFWAELPIWQPVLFVLILFLLCCLTTRFKLKAVLKSSIVKNIREL